MCRVPGRGDHGVGGGGRGRGGLGHHRQPRGRLPVPPLQVGRHLVFSVIYNVIYNNQLCRKPETGLADLTEECFQQMPLRWPVYLLMS